MAGLVLSLCTATPLAAAQTGGASVRTADGLELRFDGAGAVAGAAIGGRSLPGSGLGGFSVRSYTAPTAPGAELLSDPRFETQSGWTPSGGGFRREGGAGIVVHNAVTNVSSAAVHRLALPASAAASAARGPLALRLSGWASSDGLVSNGTCADDGNCRLHDVFGLTCTVEYSDGSSVGPPLLAPAAFQSGAHAAQFSFASLELPPPPPGSTITALQISAELRGYAGTARFHNASLALFPAVPIEATGSDALRKLNGSSLAISAAAPPSSLLPLRLNATVAAHAAHIRVDGKREADGERVVLPRSRGRVRCVRQ